MMTDSLFQSTIVHNYHRNKKAQLQHYSIPHHDSKQLYQAYHELLNHQENKDKVLDLIKKAGMHSKIKFYDGPCKYEGLHIPGPGLCWKNVVHPDHHVNPIDNQYNKVVLIETNSQLEPLHWYFMDLKDDMTSSIACSTLLMDRMIHLHQQQHEQKHSSTTNTVSSPSSSSSSSSSNSSSLSSSHFSFHSLIQKSTKSLFHHHQDTFIFIIGCPLPIQTNENDHTIYLG
ncbi:hypothetical protein BJ944DRAFT_268025 [Cunninghamella echinulata]|nr:hypothetical protein BJ944DRAFT_268025 [Cunninghamella echinulata]